MNGDGTRGFTAEPPIMTVTISRCTCRRCRLRRALFPTFMVAFTIAAIGLAVLIDYRDGHALGWW